MVVRERLVHLLIDFWAAEGVLVLTREDKGVGDGRVCEDEGMMMGGDAGRFWVEKGRTWYHPETGFLEIVMVVD